MELILLPGMDGTGILFQPFLNSVSNGISTKVIHYPCDQEISYNELTNYVQKQLPKNNVATINKSIYIQAISDNLVSEEHADIIKQVSKESKQYKVEGSHFILQVNPDKCSEIVQNEINLLTSSCSGKSGRDLKSETTTSFPEN